VFALQPLRITATVTSEIRMLRMPIISIAARQVSVELFRLRLQRGDPRAEFSDLL
jgi:hypothetical protein